MSTNRISLQPVLQQDEIAAISDFAANCGNDRIAGLAGFLRQRFELELALDPDIVAGFVRDSSNLPGKADAVCRPRTERECALILRACREMSIPCTVTGGRSNLTGSATPGDGIIISILNLLAPEVAVDTDARTVTSPVGVILEEMREQVLRQTDRKLLFPVDPTSRADACVGGVIACNASGFTPGAAGAVRNWVRAVDFLLTDGTKITARRGQYVSENGVFVLCGDLCGDAAQKELPVPAYARPQIKNAGGPFSAPGGSMDFIDLVVGSEGIFGVVTACVLGLKEAPEDYLDLFFSLPTEAEALKLHAYLHQKLGSFDELSAFEYFGVNCRKYMDHEDTLFAGDNQVGINIRVPVYGREIEDEAETWLDMLVEADCGVDEDAIILLDNPRARKTFMEARHSLPANALEKVQQRGTITIMTDTVVPRERFGEFLDFTHALIDKHGLDYLAFGHFGDCHLHFTILPQKNELALGLDIYDNIIRESARLGGVYSGEHGTGKRKRGDFLACYGPDAAREVMRCKKAVDPGLLLNRGNVFDPGDSGESA